MKIHNKFNKQEYIIYAIIIVLMFIIPTVSTLFHGHDIDDTQFLWNDMLKNWESIGLFVIVLALHDVLLAPLLVYRHKTWQYLVGVILLGAAFYSFKYFTRPADNLGPSAISKTFSTRPPLPPGNKLSALDTPPIAPPLIHRHDIISLILLMFGFGTNNGVKFYSRSLVARKEIEELEKENLNQKMEHLRYQIHPHFFMNTLNNIHALVDIDPEKAKESIIDLSKLMRYVLYECNHDYVMAAKEMGFMENYVKLMRIRYNGNLKFMLTTPDDGTQVWLPPLIFISFVENAFKHGVSTTKPSFIEIKGKIYHGDDQESRLLWTCHNSKRHDNNNGAGKVSEASGVGLSNIRHRLDLMFGENYTLNITDGEKEFLVEMDIPVKTSDPEAIHNA